MQLWTLGMWLAEASGTLALDQVQLVSPEPKDNGRFGSSIAVRGDLAVIGEPAVYGPGFGQAWIVEAPGGDWGAATFTELPAPAPLLTHRFGNTVALGDGCAFVSAVPDKDPGEFGRVYPYTLEDDAWVAATPIVGPTAGELFGHALAVSADCRTVVIGILDRDVNGKEDAGAVEVWQDDNGDHTWTLLTELIEDDPSPNHRLGYSVAVASDADGKAIGAAVAVNNLVPGHGGGWVNVYDPTEGYARINTLYGDSFQVDGLGEGLALRADGLLVVTAFYQAGTGAAYVCANTLEPDASCVQLADPDTLTLGDRMSPVAVDDELVVLGSGRDEISGDPDQTGLAHRYTLQDGTWAWSPEVLFPGDPMQEGHFGVAVALAGDTVLVGGDGVDIEGLAEAGAVYVFQLRGAGKPCTNDDQCKSGHCIMEVCGWPESTPDGTTAGTGDSTGDDAPTGGEPSGPSDSDATDPATTGGATDGTSGGVAPDPLVSFCDCDAGTPGVGGGLWMLCVLPALRRPTRGRGDRPARTRSG